MGSGSKLVVLRFSETEFEALLRRCSEFMRKQRQIEAVRVAGKPIAMLKKRSSAA
jgi:hypothetical protein